MVQTRKNGAFIGKPPGDVLVARLAEVQQLESHRLIQIAVHALGQIDDSRTALPQALEQTIVSWQGNFQRYVLHRAAGGGLKAYRHINITYTYVGCPRTIPLSTNQL